MEQISLPELKRYKTTEEFRRIFADFFWNICIQDGDENCTNKIYHINELIKYNIPNKLYKYRPITEYSILNFIEDEFVCSKAKTFNDPYDSLLYFDIPALQEFISELSEKKYIIKSYQNFQKQFKMSGKNIESLSLKEKQIISLTPDLLEEYFKSGQFSQTLMDLNSDIKNLLSSKYEYLKNTNFVGSLSENNNCPLMWGHYANSHKGFCLEYDLSNQDVYRKLRTKNTILYPVHYSEERYRATELGIYLIRLHIGGSPKLSDALFWTKALTSKSINWEYEKEWRIIYHPEEPIDNDHIFLPLKPTAIYYGTKMDKKSKESFRKIAQQKGIKEYDVRLEYDEEKFLLTPFPL